MGGRETRAACPNRCLATRSRNGLSIATKWPNNWGVRRPAAAMSVCSAVELLRGACARQIKALDRVYQPCAIHAGNQTLITKRLAACLLWWCREAFLPPPKLVHYGRPAAARASWAKKPASVWGTNSERSISRVAFGGCRTGRSADRDGRLSADLATVLEAQFTPGSSPVCIELADSRNSLFAEYPGMDAGLTP